MTYKTQYIFTSCWKA